jgi:hypothetical protein
MAGRLHTKAGFVPDDERLSGSSDSVLVDEPSIGAIARSKGSLFLVVTAPPDAPRAREAAAFLAQAVDHEYFYDESAGIAVIIEKAVRTAHRRLLQRRESHEVAEGSLGIVAAVVREHELYVVAAGDVDAYLARHGMLLVLPDEERGVGLPARDEPRLGAWRGEVMAGDTVLLASGEVSRRIDPEEIRRTITTLHPESAARHLHHQLVAADAAGSDAVIIVEVSEIPFARPERTLAARPAPQQPGPPRRDAGVVVQPTGRPPSLEPGGVAARATARMKPRLVAGSGPGEGGRKDRGPSGEPVRGPGNFAAGGATARPGVRQALPDGAVPGGNGGLDAASRGRREGGDAASGEDDRAAGPQPGPGPARRSGRASLGSRLAAARGSVAARLGSLLPRRRLEYRRVTPLADRRGGQRRAAFAALLVLVLVLLLGVAAWVAGGGLAGNQSIRNANAGEAALSAAMDEVEKVFGGGADLVAADPQRALLFLREAWKQLDLAEAAGVTAGKLRPLRDDVTEGLDRLYGVVHVTTSTVVAPKKISAHPDLSGLVRGPDGAAYTIDHSTNAVVRLDLAKKTVVTVVKQGDGPGGGIGDPWLLAIGGPDVLIVDRNSALWSWRPSDRTGRGTLTAVRIGGDVTWGTDVRDLGTYLRDADRGLYNLYVIDPSSEQILRYTPAADGSGFPQDPTGYLVTASDVSAYRQMLVDGDIYALTTATIIRLANGRPDPDFVTGVLPDEPDLRPGHEYLLMAGSASRREGRLYAYDAKYGRIVAFDKATGDYIEQYAPAPSTPIFGDVRGMFVVPGLDGRPPSIYWVSADRLYLTVLKEAPAATPSPAPSATASPSPVATPPRTPATKAPKTKAPTKTKPSPTASH